MTFFIIACICIALVAFLIFLILFEPSLKYAVTPSDVPIDSDRFLCQLGALADAQVHRNSHLEVLTGGDVFYPAELEAIRNAKQSVHLEAFIFTPSAIAQQFVDALTERARAGVQVRLVLDWLGSFTCPNRYFDGLRAAGGRVAWYQPLRWYTFKRFNNRTHRKLMVVDGILGFCGGADVAAHWSQPDKRGLPPWRDMVCRVRGSLVTGLQTTFAENWLEATGEVLNAPEDFPVCPAQPHGASGLVIVSTPSPARSSRSRLVFQVLMASARESIQINSPYFLPDRSAVAEMVRAVKERGVRVRIVTPGESNNHPLSRCASRRVYGQLLRAGIEIYEYQPGMIHKKALVVDAAWSVVGSTNFDTRSFGLNDEVNLVALDRPLAERLQNDFADEVSRSRQITYEQWRRRPLKERLLSIVGRILERQE